MLFLSGTFSDSITDPTPSIPLGILLSSCHLWNSEKICNFLATAWDNMKERSHDEKINDLQETLTSLSKDVIPLDEKNEPNWTKVLGNDWNILKIKKIVSGDDSSKSVVQLLRFIRNKYAHPNDLADKKKIAIGWFSNGEFDNTAFVTYWAHKFPKLIPFLWLKLYQSVIHSKLSNYYSCLLDPTHIKYMSQPQLDLDIYIELLHGALKSHLEKGKDINLNYEAFLIYGRKCIMVDIVMLFYL